jgi:2-dehydro-3-deoxyphosphogluconate aldolase / (4S)-4-hydroxy-2-oxoglutarate aldolase
VSDSAILDQLAATGIIAVLRAPSPQAALNTVDALVVGGITGIEVTYSTPDAPIVIAECARRYGSDILLGAGTVTTPTQAQEAVDAGATFLVSPGTIRPLAEAMRATGAPIMLGALTPTELMHAVEYGASVVKIFPASLGGPHFLKSLRGPFPDVALMPTGGVTAANLATWLSAGALAVGAGSDLCPPAAIAKGDFGRIETIAREFASALRAARAAA